MKHSRHIRKIKSFAIGGLSCLVILSLHGCDTSSTSSASAHPVKQGAFVILEEQSNGKYKVLEEQPSSITKIIVKKLDGTEEVLSDTKVQELIKQESVKIDQNQSELTQKDGGQSGFGLGSAILASAAGAILGSYIGNKLFNNPAFQQNALRNYKSPQAYERSKNSFKSTQASTSRGGGRSGFFKGGSTGGVGG